MGGPLPTHTIYRHEHHDDCSATDKQNERVPHNLMQNFATSAIARRAYVTSAANCVCLAHVQSSVCVCFLWGPIARKNHDGFAHGFVGLVLLPRTVPRWQCQLHSRHWTAQQRQRNRTASLTSYWSWSGWVHRCCATMRPWTVSSAATSRDRSGTVAGTSAVTGPHRTAPVRCPCACLCSPASLSIRSSTGPVPGAPHRSPAQGWSGWCAATSSLFASRRRNCLS